MRFPLSHHRHLLIASLLLAVGVGGAASMFTVGRALTAAGLPYPSADRLVMARVGGPSWSPAMLETVNASTTVFDATAGFQERAATLTSEQPGGLTAEIVRLETVSASYFDLLGAHAAVGRVFTADEDRRNWSTPVAVISDALWTRRFGHTAAVLGQRLVADGRALEVIGVMPARFRGLIGRTDVWAPLGSARWLSGDTGPERPTSRWFEVLARRRPELTDDGAEARFAVEARAAILALPAGDRIIGPRTALRLVPLASARMPLGFPQAARVLATAVAAMLVIVIVNMTSLHLLRVDTRRREIAIRLALGANLKHIAMMAAREVLVVSAIASLGAILLRPFLLSTLNAIQPASTSFGIVTAQVLTPESMRIDLGSSLAVIGLAIVATLPLACAFLLKARRLDLERTLRGGVAPSGGRRLPLPPGRTILVAVQAALACAVIGGGALLTRSAAELIGRERGYQIDDVVTAKISLPQTYDDARASLLYRELVTRLEASPGVSYASVSNCAPGGGRCRRSSLSKIDGRAIEPAAQPTVGINYVTPDHFNTIGARRVQGRLIEAQDRSGAPLVVVITQTLASQLWPGVSPIGRTLEIFTGNGSLDGARTVIGTIEPIAFNLETDPGLDVFLPAAQSTWTSGVVFVKGPAVRAQRLRLVADTVAGLDRAVPVHDGGGLDVTLARSLAIESLLRQTLWAFGAMGLLLALVGTYVIVAQAITDRRRELSIRIALGATPAQIRWLAGRRGMWLASASAAIGAGGAFWAGALLRSFLHGLSPRDPFALVIGPAITALAMLAAVLWPAIRAAHQSPVTSIRVDS